MDDFGTSLVTPQAGGQQYADTEFQTQKRQLAPQYAQAIRQARQSAANRGLGSSGIGQEQEQQIGQEYRGNLFGASQGAALEGANVNLENQRQQLARNFAQQQQDRMIAAERQRMEEQQQNSNNQMWGNALIGVGTGAGRGLASWLMPRPAVE